ncbi:hypothetical protein ST47_g3583 [Ascochyta rabiei]|uniref:Heterokaryon incompatibility domain-containing protein n=1 Tax=Didymella rabiei TaxID=5454 RepID=A0A163HFN3_DIDRA|nr:hypothetical protein ST47_g3583 [Ascochyta rabiei]
MPIYSYLATTAKAAAELAPTSKQLRTRGRGSGMRLLNVSTFELQPFYGDDIPPYVILSHTWLQEDEEVTFEQLRFGHHWRALRGARKIEYTCKQAAQDGYNSELSEPINSMFQWYQKAEVCYAYLMDIEQHSTFLNSRWWSWVWTLQELVAPSRLQFYDQQWKTLGFKHQLANEIASQIGIDAEVLCDSSKMLLKSVATRMLWAAHRQATRAKDPVYCLLGIFNIRITMQYGEVHCNAGAEKTQDHAKVASDLVNAWFEWPIPSLIVDDIDWSKVEKSHSCGTVDSDLFAPSLDCFENSGGIKLHNPLAYDTYVEEQRGIFELSAYTIPTGSLTIA